MTPAILADDLPSIDSIVEELSISVDVEQPGIRCVPIKRLYSAEILAFSQIHGGLNYLSLLKYD